MNRSAGILMHITSLPGKFGIGDFGPEAYNFADWLHKSGIKLWQVLPLNPTTQGMGNSPYSSFSAFAINPILISPQQMVYDHYLDEADIESRYHFSHKKVKFEQVYLFKQEILAKAWHKFRDKPIKSDFEEFCNRESNWLTDFATYFIIKKTLNGKPWNEWPIEYRDRSADALHSFNHEFADEINKIKFIQFLGYNQWEKLKKYCNEQFIRIIGDIPIYVHFKSADIWSNQELFKLDEDKKPTFVAGVPPDYFSETGQLWGNPVYNWDIMKLRGFKWWIKRIEQNLKIFDIIRIDHFRGLVGAWEVPSTETTAVNGQWVQVPSDDFFKALKDHFSDLPLIAEDLGMITDDVREFLARTNLPGMKVFHFGIMSMEPDNEYLPHNYSPNCVAYTGTHDNNTTRGWFKHELNAEQKAFLENYLGGKSTSSKVAWESIRMLLFSVANDVVFPMQDILNTAQNTRMNKPGEAWKNWEWRMEKIPDDEMAKTLKDQIDVSGRGVYELKN